MTKTIIEDHRAMFLLSGQMSDFQIKNLRAFPYIIFDDLYSFTLNYNFYKYDDSGDQHITPGSVDYDLIFKEDAKELDDIEKMKEKITHLKTFVQTLFWKETSVNVLKNGEKII